MKRICKRHGDDSRRVRARTASQRTLTVVCPLAVITSATELDVCFMEVVAAWRGVRRVE